MEIRIVPRRVVDRLRGLLEAIFLRRVARVFDALLGDDGHGLVAQTVASSSAKFVGRRWFTVGLDDVDLAGVGGEVYFRFAETDALRATGSGHRGLVDLGSRGIPGLRLGADESRIVGELRRARDPGWLMIVRSVY